MPDSPADAPDPAAPSASARPFPRWLLRAPSDEAAARIFCFPYSGVGASMFNPWPRWIGAAEVCPVQLPNRENRIRDPHYGTYQDLAALLAECLAPYLDRPSIFFGHCAGSLPAFETVRALAGLGAALPTRLVVSAQVAPHDCPHDRWLYLTDSELVAELGHLVVARGGRPHPALLEMTLEVLHRDLDANRVYRLPEPVPVPVGVTVLHWSGDTEVTAEELRGWAHYASDVRFAVLDGEHYDFLHLPPGLRELLSTELSTELTTELTTGPAASRAGLPGGGLDPNRVWV